MLNKIPWYVALFQSLPESFLILKLGLILLRIDVKVKDALIISAIAAAFSYFIRLYFMTFGMHTFYTLILLMVLVTLIGEIRMINAAIGIFIGVLIVGVLQSISVPLLLSLMGISISELGIFPILNIILFIPSGLIMGLTYLIVSKKNFYLIDLNTYTKD